MPICDSGIREKVSYPNFSDNCKCMSAASAHTLSRVQLSRRREQKPATLLCLWDVSGKNMGVGCNFLLPGIFPTQGSNWRLPAHLSVFLYSS